MDRRHFLTSLTALGVEGVMLKAGATQLGTSLTPAPKPRRRGGARRTDENLVVFISDMHVLPADYEAEKLTRVVNEILAMRPLPKHVIGLGDLANLYGHLEDYESARPVLQPLEDAGIEVTLTMGNHDRRENFARVFPEKATATKVKGRMTFIVETPRMDFILLDSLDQGDDPNKWITPGTLDEGQRNWLRETLQSYTKPVVVCAHHPIHETKVADLIFASPTCCGYIHGHDHRWRPGWNIKQYNSRAILRTLCVPSTGYWGDIGYTTVRMEEECATAELKMLEYFFHSPLKPDEQKPAQWTLIEEDLRGARCRFSYQRPGQL